MKAYIFDGDYSRDVYVDDLKAIFDSPPNVLLVHSISLPILGQLLYGARLSENTYQPHVVELCLSSERVRRRCQRGRIVEYDKQRMLLLKVRPG